MKKLFICLLLLPAFFACNNLTEIQKCGLHYQQHQDFKNLNRVVELMPAGSDTSYVRTILGEPIDMGFDFRYLTDSTGPQGCVVGAVFHINEKGKVDQQWADEICE